MVLLGWSLLPARVAPADLVIHEVMYHPEEVWPTNQPAPTPNPTEYIELLNAGTDTVDLIHYRLDDGVQFSFPASAPIGPGEFVVVCEDRFAFSKAYSGVVAEVYGDFEGGLRDGGEWIQLSRWTGSEWVVADRFRYVDGGPTDGTGPSLELVHPGFARLDEQGEGAWRPSLAARGTPGAPNGVHDPAPPPAVAWVKHRPLVPPAGSCVTITARVTGRDSDAVDTVRLRYRKDALPQNVWQIATMHDDGLRGDVRAKDGIFTLRYPEPGDPPMAEGDILEFLIDAIDPQGHRIAPSEHTAGVQTGLLSYLCYFGEDTGFDGEYDTYRIVMTRSNRSWL
ncbi:MAG: lamin tail domain-containing protein, partial [Verrucomicrobiota bacterium]